MTSNQPYIPFSQRTGLEPIPPQLKLRQVSDELRRLLDYYLGLEIDRAPRSGMYSQNIGVPWRRVAMDFHVVFLNKDAATFEAETDNFRRTIRVFIQQEKIGKLFNLVEFFIRHPFSSRELKTDLAGAFVTARAAYRIIDGLVVAIGTDEQAVAFAGAIADTEANSAGAARAHLVAAGSALRNSDWAGCIRESIHAVEATALRLAPGTATLGPALTALEKQGHVHGGLKAAFGALYGYSSDEKGIRHSLVFKDEAQVDETDALFMLGACASFVSYLLARTK
ncbi:hypothetical protein ACSBOB_19615 [Mesorhizobium sp. ASY16-5R]|uniref:hypothetical protein n=1 Tax=Mesorhizobium sp. ASY16-5R TaxID=3445772 RepID=UPI003F9FDCC6